MTYITNRRPNSNHNSKISLNSLALQVANGIKDYCIGFAKRKPIIASLIALECGSWAYLGLKRYVKSYILWNTVLELDLKGDYTMTERDPLDEIFNLELRNQLTFLSLIQCIENASHDWRIKGLFLRLDSKFKMGLAQCEELRAVLLNFKQNDKQIVVYADNLSMWGMNAFRHYLIASVADRIYMSTDGILHLGAATVDYPFYWNTLSQKLNLSCEIRRRSQYKSAGNTLFRSKFDKHHREQYTQLLQNLELNFIDTIACARKLRPYSINNQLSAQPNVFKLVQWTVQQILERENATLEFIAKTQTDAIDQPESRTIIEGIPEAKSQEDDQSVVPSIVNRFESDQKAQIDMKDFDCNLIHSWSFSLGDYKTPKFYCVLQFYHTEAQIPAYYEAVVKLATKSLGIDQTDAEMKDDEVVEEPQTLESYKLLPGFQPGPKTVLICKPGDIVVSPDDNQYDEDFGRTKVRSTLKDVSITIERTVHDILHYGGYNSGESLQLGLIDGVKSHSQIYTDVWPTLLDLEEKKISFLFLHRYHQRVNVRNVKKGIRVNGGGVEANFYQKYISSPETTKVAYIACTQGAIIDGKSTKDQIGSSTVCRQLRAARKKKEIKGVVLHLDTPGGSVTACHNIREEILAIKKEGKPVIAVQSNIAASGGYYLSAPCDYVISSPSTITGSIGIIGGKFTTRKFWKSKLGIDYDRITTNRDGSYQWSMLDGFGDYERARLELHLTQWYENFKSIIHVPRRMSMERVEKVAKGQIWLGAQALEIGLVDQLGGTYDALKKMKDVLELPENTKLDLVNPLGKMKIWDLILGVQPEHENDFSVPRKSLHLLNPVSWLMSSSTVNLIFANVATTSLMSSLMMSVSRNTKQLTSQHDLVAQVADDFTFLKQEIEMFNQNEALMYDSTLALFQRKQLL